MKRFRNRLVVLERLRNLERREARIGLARAASDLRQRQAVVQSRLDDLRGSEATFDELARTGDAVQLKRWSDWCTDRREKLEQARCDLDASAKRLEAARSGYRTASTEVRVLDQLRERRWRVWRSEVEREETAFLSESYLQRWIRRTGSGREES